MKQQKVWSTLTIKMALQSQRPTKYKALFYGTALQISVTKLRKSKIQQGWRNFLLGQTSPKNCSSQKADIKHVPYSRPTNIRHCLTSWKVADSIPDYVIGIFHWHNPSGRTMALGLTQPLIEMSTRNISWGSKGSRCVGLTTLPPSCAECHEIREPQPPATLRACPGL